MNYLQITSDPWQNTWTTPVQGWQCPACKLIHAPHVPSCYCQSNPPFTTVTYSYSPTQPGPNTATATP